MLRSAARYDGQWRDGWAIKRRSIVRLLASIIMLACVGVAPAVLAQSETTIPAEHGKLPRAPQALGVLGPDLFGDKVNIYNGSL